MVNAKNVAFKVNAQAPMSHGPPVALGTVINCRRSTPSTRKCPPGQQKEVRSHQMPLANIAPSTKRKRTSNDAGHAPRSRDFAPASGATGGTSRPGQALINQAFPQTKNSSPTTSRVRRSKVPSKGVDIDSWWTILCFSDPGQLLEMRTKIASCYRFLRDNPMLWKHSRRYAYGETMPDPCSELDEFQFAHLRHGHGCMSCNAPSTRKTYWAFLRRWCKTCLQSKTIKEHDAVTRVREATGGIEPTWLPECLPSGVFDSWGNFVGVGPATTHSLKTIYLLSDVQRLIAEFNEDFQANPESWPVQQATWIAGKAKLVGERRTFARKMESCEETTRSAKTTEYNAKKLARRKYFAEKALQLDPPITMAEMEKCPSYRRAVAIPKEPNNTSWLQLKPKLEKEAADLDQPKPSLPVLSRRPTPTPTPTLTPTPTPTPAPSHHSQVPQPSQVSQASHTSIHSHPPHHSSYSTPERNTEAHRPQSFIPPTLPPMFGPMGLNPHPIPHHNPAPRHNPIPNHNPIPHPNPISLNHNPNPIILNPNPIPIHINSNPNPISLNPNPNPNPGPPSYLLPYGLHR